MILQKEIENPGIVPIYIPLKTLSNFDEIKFQCKSDFRQLLINASANTLFNKDFRYSLPIETYLMRAFEEKNVFLLFDGLDECNEESREFLIGLVSDLSRELVGESKIIMTSRLLNYSDHNHQFSSNFQDEESFNKWKQRMLVSVLEFKNATLLPFDVNQQIEMTRKSGLKSVEFDNMLLGKKYHEFSQVPLFLSLMICYYRDHQEMPEQKSKLFGNVIDMIINVYFQKKGGNLTTDDIQKEKANIIEFLTKIATFMHQNRMRVFAFKDINQFGLVFENVWEEYLDNIKAGLFPLLVPDANGLTFYHPAFQDFLVASDWSTTQKQIQLRSQNFKRNTMDSKTANFLEVVLDPWYRNTFLLMPDLMNREDHRDFCK
jgi:hypothetical protein